jgi:hypothetical protein
MPDAIDENTAMAAGALMPDPKWGMRWVSILGRNSPPANAAIE